MKINTAVVVALQKALPSKTVVVDTTANLAIKVNTSQITAANPNPIVMDRWTHGELEMFHLLTPALQALIVADLAGTAANF
jgi:hypothetical protein